MQIAPKGTLLTYLLSAIFIVLIGILAVLTFTSSRIDHLDDRITTLETIRIERAIKDCEVGDILELRDNGDIRCAKPEDVYLYDIPVQ